MKRKIKKYEVSYVYQDLTILSREIESAKEPIDVVRDELKTIFIPYNPNARYAKIKRVYKRELEKNNYTAWWLVIDTETGRFYYYV